LHAEATALHAPDPTVINAMAEPTALDAPDGDDGPDRSGPVRAFDSLRRDQPFA
jgi:hypothetical protein